MTHKRNADQIKSAWQIPNLIEEAFRRGLTPAQFAEIVRRTNGDKAKILTVLKGL